MIRIYDDEDHDDDRVDEHDDEYDDHIEIIDSPILASAIIMVMILISILRYLICDADAGSIDDID